LDPSSNLPHAVFSPPPEHSQELPPEEPVLLGRGHRIKRPTWKVLEQLPQPPAPVVETVTADSTGMDLSNETEDTRQQTFIWRAIRTVLDGFGLFREYGNSPSHSPDDSLTIEDMSYCPSEQPTSVRSTSESPANSSWPLSFSSINKSAFRLMSWMWTGSPMKSMAEVDRLVNTVLLAPDFSIKELTQDGFSAKRETAALDKHLELLSTTNQTSSNEPSVGFGDGWKNTSVTIKVPDGRSHHPGTNDPPIPTFSVPGLYYCSLTSIIRDVWSSNSAKRFHLTPFLHFWRRDDGRIERVYGELYSSDAYVDAYKEVQNLPAERDCTLERVVCALMLWSDSTQLANFGTASLWPIYLFFGNESKYTRATMRADSCHHVAYIPKVHYYAFNDHILISIHSYRIRLMIGSRS
jgi:hypothetical protein